MHIHALAQCKHVHRNATSLLRSKAPWLHVAAPAGGLVLHAGAVPEGLVACPVLLLSIILRVFVSMAAAHICCGARLSAQRSNFVVLHLRD
eukprot:scaffold75059_cov22-Tisochrysis_lutea.AAC.1